MLLKRLDELSESEFKFEFEKAGLEGNSDEALCIIRLTMYLVKVGEDPFSFQFKISEEIEKSQPKDLEVECELFSSSWPADGLSAETSSVSLPETLPVLVGSSLLSIVGGSTVLSSPSLAEYVSVESMLTLPRTVGSSLMSFPSSSYRAVSFSNACRESQPIVLVMKWISESDGDSNDKLFGSFRPVMWPPDMCCALRQQHLGISCTQHIYCSSC